MSFNNIFMILIIFLLVLVLFMGFFYTLYKNIKKDNIVYQEQAKLANDKLTSNMLTFEENKQNLIISQTNLNNLKEQLTNVQAELTQAKQTIAELTNDNSVLKAKLEYQNTLTEETKKIHEISNKELENRLNTLSEQILNKRQEQFSNFSLDKLQSLVNPLEKELNLFKEFVLQNQKISSEQTGQLASDLKKLFDTQASLSQQANELTHALRAGGKAPGIWGEYQLELILENCGLIKGEHYQREVSGKRSNDESGRIDAIVYLPQNHCLLIDSKCSLTSFCDYMNSTDEASKEQALKDYFKSITTHIDGLAERNYDSYKSFSSPSFVFMFIPIDEALNLVLRYKQDLYTYANNKNIYLVSPISLIPTLKTVANLWVISSQTERLKDLAKDAINIYKEALAIQENYEAIVKKEASLNKAITDLGTRLYLKKGSLIGRIEKFNLQAPKIIASQENVNDDGDNNVSIVNSANKLDKIEQNEKD